MNIKQLKEQADQLFTKRTSYISLLQEIANNFYPQRANFTYERSLGQEYADQLMSSYPVMVTRDLGNQLGSMLRPTNQEWFRMGLKEGDPDIDGKRYLEWVAKGIRRMMYHQGSQFHRATKQGDHDFGAFGQCVIQITPSRDASHFLYRNHHLKDCAWSENEDGNIGFFARRDKMTARDLYRLFGDKIDPKVKTKVHKEPWTEFNCVHIVCEADYYSNNANGKPYWSLYYDCDNDKLLEEVAMWDFEYLIPRWQTVSGSQYAFSPATITALPDARLIQSMTLSLLEAGEKAVNPPMVATHDAVKSDVAIYAGGITWVDMEYDEKTGEALRPLSQDFRGMPFGFEMQADIRMQLRQAFYLDRLQLPVNAPEMTAYEVGQRVQEYIRQAMPIFEPMEYEYNGQLCEITYRRMLRAGFFGNPADNMPKSLSNREYNFEFESPLHDAIEQQKGQKFLEAKALIAEAASLDRTTYAAIDAKKALQESLQGIGIPAEWIRSRSELDEFEKQQQDQLQSQSKLDEMEQSSQIAVNLAQAKEANVA